MIVPVLCKKFKKAQRGLKDALEAFNMLSLTALPTQLSEWMEQAAFAAAGWLNDATLMDIYDIQLPTGK